MARLPDTFGSDEVALPSLDGLRDHLRVGLDRIADDAGIVDVAMLVDARDLKSLGAEMEEVWMDKAEIARRQLGKALALFIDDEDSVSVHCLACGGGEIAEHLTLKAGQESFSAHARKHRPELDAGKLRGIRNQYWNTFKHATSRSGLDRQDEEFLASFSDEINDHTLFVGWYDYARASPSLPIEAQVFQAWYFAMYPEKIVPHKTVEDSVRVFGADLKVIPRAEAKRRLHVVIERSREDRELMDDPQTENRPLDLGPIG